MRDLSRLFLIADITRRLKAPDPTIRLGPRSSCLKSLKTIPTMLSRISGADLRRKNSCILGEISKNKVSPWTKRHKDNISNGAIPYRHLHHLLLPVWPGHGDLLGGRGDGINGAHEDVSHNEHRDKAVEQPYQVECDPDPGMPDEIVKDWE